MEVGRTVIAGNIISVVSVCGIGKQVFPVNEVRLLKPGVGSHFRFQT